MSWNGYPSYVCNVILIKLRERKKNANGHCSDYEDDDTPRIWRLRVPYIGPFGEKFAKKCISKLRKCCKKELNFILMFETKKAAFFCSNKDPLPVNLQSHVIYQFECPVCKAKYIGKTGRYLKLRLNEQLDFRTTAVGKHLYECEHFHHIVKLYSISVCSNSVPPFIETFYHISSTISRNTQIIDKNNNWTQLCWGCRRGYY